jgi:hypothetical protein
VLTHNTYTPFHSNIEYPQKTLTSETKVVSFACYRYSYSHSLVKGKKAWQLGLLLSRMLLGLDSKKINQFF